MTELGKRQWNLDGINMIKRIGEKAGEVSRGGRKRAEEGEAEEGRGRQRKAGDRFLDKLGMTEKGFIR